MKTIGALICVTGAVIATLYKGKEFHIGHHHLDSNMSTAKKSHSHSTRGILFLIGSSVCHSGWFVLQVLHHLKLDSNNNMF